MTQIVEYVGTRALFIFVLVTGFPLPLFECLVVVVFVIFILVIGIPFFASGLQFAVKGVDTGLRWRRWPFSGMGGLLSIFFLFVIR